MMLNVTRPQQMEVIFISMHIQLGLDIDLDLKESFRQVVFLHIFQPDALSYNKTIGNAQFSNHNLYFKCCILYNVGTLQLLSVPYQSLRMIMNKQMCNCIHCSMMNAEKRRFNSFVPGQNGHHFADDILKGILINENLFILILISLKFVPKGLIDNKPALVKVMAWCWGSKSMLTQFTDAYMRH